MACSEWQQNCLFRLKLRSCLFSSGWHGFRCRHRRYAGCSGSEENPIFVPRAAGGVRRLLVSLHVTWTLWSVSHQIIYLLFISHKECKRTEITCTTYLGFITHMFISPQVFWTMTVLWTMTPVAYVWQKCRLPTRGPVILFSFFGVWTTWIYYSSLLLIVYCLLILMIF